LGTDFHNTGFSRASIKLAVKYWPGWWNTGHLATLRSKHVGCHERFLLLAKIDKLYHELNTLRAGVRYIRTLISA